MTKATAPNGDKQMYGYDAMGRAATMQYQYTDAVSHQRVTTDLITGVNYGPAGELLRTLGGSTEMQTSRTYNSRLQLTSVDGNTISYGLAGQNNGQIASEKLPSGETVVYSYDALNRLVEAHATNGSWGQGFTYDGFGNLYEKRVTAGSAPVLNVTVNAAKNQIGNSSWGGYDANGNPITGFIYDAENRMVRYKPAPFVVATSFDYGPGKSAGVGDEAGDAIR